MQNCNQTADKLYSGQLYWRHFRFVAVNRIWQIAPIDGTATSAASSNKLLKGFAWKLRAESRKRKAESNKLNKYSTRNIERSPDEDSNAQVSARLQVTLYGALSLAMNCLKLTL